MPSLRQALCKNYRRFSARFLLTLQTTAAAQSGPCAVPSFSKVVNEPNFFNEQQEIWLGQILDEQVLKHYNVVARSGARLSTEDG